MANVLFYILIIFILIVLWAIRQPITGLLIWVAFLFADVLHKKQANKIVNMLEKLDNEDLVTALKAYKRKFLGLKFFGFILLLVYSYVTAVIAYVFLQLFGLDIIWLYYLVFLYTLAIYWPALVTNIPINYIIFRAQKKESENQ